MFLQFHGRRRVDGRGGVSRDGMSDVQGFQCVGNGFKKEFMALHVKPFIHNVTPMIPLAWKRAFHPLLFTRLGITKYIFMGCFLDDFRAVFNGMKSSFHGMDA
ncbi:hypothetical protein [Caenibacillus caldisaponilyticus]|uniref:hypothetical protein n=1 Tax=Caenibacillus caldisaponilyticus TaxID=1674942 RepID=UPI001EE712B6|nr:hypothetical protein [Caenibacillus caldisaponilyticus]